MRYREGMILHCDGCINSVYVVKSEEKLYCPSAKRTFYVHEEGLTTDGDITDMMECPYRININRKRARLQKSEKISSKDSLEAWL